MGLAGTLAMSALASCADLLDITPATVRDASVDASNANDVVVVETFLCGADECDAGCCLPDKTCASTCMDAGRNTLYCDYRSCGPDAVCCVTTIVQALMGNCRTTCNVADQTLCDPNGDACAPRHCALGPGVLGDSGYFTCQ